MEIRKDLGIYTALEYSGGAVRICKAIPSVQVCETKLKTARAALENCTGFFGTVRDIL